MNDLEFIEFSSYVEVALAERGMARSNDFASADLVIFLGYGIGDPETSNYTLSMPVIGKTGVSSSYTSGTVNVYGNSATYSGTTTYTPTYGITGYNSIQGSRTTFTSRAFLTAYDLNHYRKTEEEIVLWDTRIVSVGSSADLRQVFPVLIAAAIDRIGTNTGKMLFVSLNEEDSEVKFVKGQIPKRKK